jgi:hypothetical protein
MRYSDFNSLKENASSGASSSANVASLAMPFFSSDPKATAQQSIYGAQPGAKKTKKKATVIRRS